jgi:hypothetical protein
MLIALDTLNALCDSLMRLQEGSYAIILQSGLFPGEAVCARRGSPLLFGIKSKEPVNVCATRCALGSLLILQRRTSLCLLAALRRPRANAHSALKAQQLR